MSAAARLTLRARPVASAMTTPNGEPIQRSLDRLVLQPHLAHLKMQPRRTLEMRNEAPERGYLRILERALGGNSGGPRSRPTAPRCEAAGYPQRRARRRGRENR